MNLHRLVCLLGLGISTAVSAPLPVWIDTDPSAAPGGHEVDDAVALVQAFGSPELGIRGVSITYGNADLPTASEIGRRIVHDFGPRQLPVFDGAGGPGDLGKDTAAASAIASALRKQRLTILALGPVTNVATVVKNHPELAGQIVEIIAVAGRKPGQKFLSGPKQTKPFRDLNFELDPDAFQVLLDTRIPLTLAPWEISSRVWLRSDDVNALLLRRPALRTLQPALEDWLQLWKRDFGTDGFNPFDALAVGYLVSRKALHCTEVGAGIESAQNDTGPGRKPYLLVGPPQADGRRVRYCDSADPEFKNDLLRRLQRTTRKP